MNDREWMRGCTTTESTVCAATATTTIATLSAGPLSAAIRARGSAANSTPTYGVTAAIAARVPSRTGMSIPNTDAATNPPTPTAPARTVVSPRYRRLSR